MKPTNAVLVAGNDSCSGDHTVVSAITSFSRRSGFSSTDDDHWESSRTTDAEIFTKTVLYGRDSEQKILIDALHSVVSNKSKVVHVCGASGSGKSALVESIRVPASNEGAFFVAEKFDEMRHKEPFSEIVTSLSDLCDLIVQSDELSDVRERLQKNMSTDEMQALLPLISKNLQDVVGSTPETANDTNPSIANTNDHNTYSWGRSFTRFKILCRKFLLSVATPKHPVVWFLDDLQWADAASIAVIRTLAMDAESENVLLVLAYRTRQECERIPEFDSFLADTVARGHGRKEGGAGCTGDGDEKKEEKENFGHLETLNVQIGNLGIDQINEIVGDRLKMPTESTRELSEVIHAKTFGCVFCVLEFLDMLRAENLISFRKIEGYTDDVEGVVWDLERIQSETNVSDNVVSLLLSKIQRLPSNVQGILRIASCLSYHFDLELLLCVIKDKSIVVHVGDDMNLQSVPSDKGELKKLLQVASDVGLIEMMNKGEDIKFAHDKVRSSLYNSLPAPADVHKIHLGIGRLVQRMMGDSLRGPPERAPRADRHHTSGDRLLFLAADHMNLGSAYIEDDSEKLALARLNLEAGNSSMSKKSAYVSAAGYLQKGVEMLPVGDAWGGDTYQLALEIHTSLAKAESGSAFVHTNWEDVITTILCKAKTVDAKLPAYEIAMEASIVQGNFVSAIRYGKKVLRDLGERFPATEASTGQVLVEMLRTKTALKKYSDEEILSLPEATDRRKVVIIKALHDIGRGAFYINQPKNMVLCYCRALRLTLKHGLSNKAPCLFAKQGMIQTLLGHHDLSARYGRMAMKLLERPSVGEEQEAETIAYTHMFTAHFKKRGRDLCPAFQRGYVCGMRTGDVPFALMNAGNIATILFSNGASLYECEDMLRNICKTAKEYHVEFLMNVVLLPYWQMFLNLMYETEDPKVLTGEAMNEDDLMATDPSPMGRHQIAFMKMQIAFVFDDWGYLKETIPAMQVLRKSVRGITAHSFAWEYMSMTGIAYHVLQRRSRRPSRYRSYARKALRRLKDAIESGMSDCKPFYYLMLAEKCVLDQQGKSVRIVKDAYDLAILTAREADARHYVAIGLERAGRTFLELLDRDKAREYLTLAHEAYFQWGASPKCEQLERFMSQQLLTRW